MPKGRRKSPLVEWLKPEFVTHAYLQDVVSGAASPVDHGGLTGLGDDDHTQYVHISSARTISAVHTFNPPSPGAPFTLGANAQGQLVTGLNADLLDGLTSSNNPGANARILASTAAGALTLEQLTVDSITLNDATISSVADLTLDAAGGDVLLPSAVNIGADNFASESIGWRVTYAGAADFRSVFSDEIHTRAFIADIEQAVAGGEIVTPSVTLLFVNYVVITAEPIGSVAQVGQRFVLADETLIDVGVTTGDTIVVSGSTGNDGTYTVSNVFGTTSCIIEVNEPIPDPTPDGNIAVTKHVITVEDLPGFPATAAFVTGDWVRMRSVDRSAGGLSVADVWGTVSGYSDNADGTQDWLYTVQDDGGLDSDPIYAGTVVLDYGSSGDGYWEVNARGGAANADTPYTQIRTWSTDPSVPGNHTLRMRLGNLDGVTDPDFPTVGGWGLYSDNAFLSGSLLVQDDSEFQGVVTIGTSGEIRQGSGTLGSNFTGLRIWNDGGLGRIGGYNSNALQWYADTDGKLYGGAGAVIVDADGLRVAGYTSVDPDDPLGLAESNQIKFTFSSSRVFTGYADRDVSDNSETYFVAINDLQPNANQALNLRAQNAAVAGTEQATLRIFVQGGNQVDPPSSITGTLTDGSGFTLGTTLGAFSISGLNVGIGTSSPDELLHVENGKFRVSHDISSVEVLLTDDSDNDTWGLRFERSTDHVGMVSGNANRDPSGGDEVMNWYKDGEVEIVTGGWLNIVSSSGGKALSFDGGEAMITIHDGAGNFNILGGIDENGNAVGGTGGGRIRIDDGGGLFFIDYQTGTVGNAVGNATTVRLDSSIGGMTLTGTFPYFGVGVQPPQFALDVYDNNPTNGYAARFYSDGNVSGANGIAIRAGQDTNPTHNAILFQDGNGTTIGSVAGDGAGGVNYNQTSDRRSKEDIADLKSSLARVMGLRPVEYRGVGAPSGRGKSHGLIAQEVAEVIPSAVTYNEEEDLYSLAWNKIIPDLVGAIKELEQRVAQLEAA